MPSTPKQCEASSSSKSTTAPYEQPCRTLIKKRHYFCDKVYDEEIQKSGWKFDTIRWGSVSFDVRLVRRGTMDVQFDLEVVCNRGASDPHWFCEFAVSANGQPECTHIASNDNNKLITPVVSLPEKSPPGYHINWTIRMISWSGVFPPLLHSFSTKTDISDATLIVEGKHLYVSRALLALHSTFFNTLFFDDKFPDAAKDEFPLVDVSYDDMTLYLAFVSPNIADDAPEEKFHSIDAIESMLALAERFGNDTLTREMEQYLMGQKGGIIEGHTPARVLLIADRFRLSEPASHIMQRLQSEAARLALGDTEEYWQLSADLKAAILDASMRRNRQSIEAPEANPPLFTEAMRSGMFHHYGLADPWEDDPVDDLQMRMRLRRQDPRLARRRRPSPPGFVSALSSNNTFEMFTMDLTRLGIALNDMNRNRDAASLDKLDGLERSLRYLRGLSRSDYHRISSSSRAELHRFINHIVSDNNVDLYIRMLNVEVSMVRNEESGSSRGPSNRSVEGSARKRMRLRDYVLDSP